MTIIYYGYPKCGTCRKAKSFLEAQGADFQEVNIADNPPSSEELKKIVEASGLPLKKFYNVSGQKYRELGLKDKISGMSEEEQYELLASEGMLIKRPLVTDGSKSTVGFSESVFEENWKS